MSSNMFPEFEHQSAPILLAGKSYFRNEVVRLLNPDLSWKASYKFIADVPAGVISTVNLLDYAHECPRLRIPNPSRPFKEGLKVNSIIYTADNGYEQRRDRGVSKKTFELTWAALSLDQYITIRDFFLEVMNTRPFLWLHPITKRPHLVRFANEVFQGENKGHGPKGPWYSLNLALMEVFA